MPGPLITFEVDGVGYQVARLDAVTQFGLYTKLSPLLAHIDPLIKIFRDRAGLLADAADEARREGKDPTQADVQREIAKKLPDIDLKALEPLTTGLSRMDDDVQRSIMRTLLGPVMRAEEGGGVTPIWHPKSDTVVHEDINGLTMLKIAWRVFEENLKSFFGGAAPSFPLGSKK